MGAQTRPPPRPLPASPREAQPDEAGFGVVWLQAGACGGCTMAALGADDIGFEAALARFGVRFLHHPALSEETGQEARDRLDAIARGEERLDALCLEGSVLGGAFHERAGGGAFRELIAELAAQARYVVAVGSCAAFGGVPAAGCNPADAEGLQFGGDRAGGLLGPDFRSKEGLPVINVAGCAPHPGWIVETLAALSMDALSLRDLDAFARPRFYADHLAHHGCARNEYYEFKASAESFAQAGCMMEHLGCKGTQAAGDCNQRRWSGGAGCTDAGYSCVACTQPGFEEASAAFLETEKLAGIPLGLPRDMPKAWFVALAALSKSATPKRVRENATRQTPEVSPWPRDDGA
ncbi:MAG: hypothetical protein MI723_18140 [Caulobacterales bacterium]|nr:hypothetical protein [Caulobacterales bacterium]